MKYKYRILILLGVLWLFSIFLSLIGVLTAYKSPTIANEPAIKRGNYFFTSNLPSYNNGDLICFKHNDQLLGKHKRVYRLVAKENDTIEIIAGVLFVNGQDVDKDLSLKHYYELEGDKAKEMVNNQQIESNQIIRFDTDKSIVLLEDDEAKKYGLYKNIKIKPKDESNSSIKAIYQNDWNIDNFGPLTIPQGKCFVMGDNRPSSEDSRYIGLIDETNVAGKVVYIFD